MKDLGRVNLLVGANNSGKTSVLEALYMLASQANAYAFSRFLWRRGEIKVDRTSRSERFSTASDPSHLFFGHELGLGNSFELTAKNQDLLRHLTVQVKNLTQEEWDSLGYAFTGDISRTALRLKGSPEPTINTIPLSSSGTISMESIDVSRRRKPDENLPRVQFLTTDTMDGVDLVEMWNSVALTSDEDFVLGALASLDENIERIAPQIPSTLSGLGTSRSGFVIKHDGFKDPIPIGSMGDGVWRLLSIAICITQCRNGFLLIDEIASDLHYSALSNIWDMIISASRRLNVQVFATTYSLDCIQSLAQCLDGSSSELDTFPRVVLHRIEADQSNSVSYSERQIQLAVETSLDLR